MSVANKLLPGASAVLPNYDWPCRYIGPGQKDSHLVGKFGQHLILINLRIQDENSQRIFLKILLVLQVFVESQQRIETIGKHQL